MAAMSAVPPPQSSIPPGIASLFDYEAHARELLDGKAWAYLNGGAADEITMRSNRAAFDQIRLNGRVLADVAGGHTRLDLFGARLTHPILMAPVAHQRLFHPTGELGAVQAASAIGAGMVVSSMASTLLEDIAAQVVGVPLWFQLYIQPDRGFTEALVRRAEASGYTALVLTVDAPVSGVRNREQRAQFRLPPGIESVNLRGMALPPARGLGPADSRLFDDLLRSAPTWKDLAWLRSLTTLPIIVKGVLSADDAQQAADLGASGIIVSNHGGRTLDTLPATIDALPAVARRVGERLPVLMDGGIRRGTDVLKALALGARAVLVGRPWVHGLAVAGPLGAAHALKILREELEVAMALTGCATLDDIGTKVLFRLDS